MPNITRTAAPAKPIRASYPTLRHAWIPYGGMGLSALGVFDAVRGAHGIINFASGVTAPGVYQSVSSIGPVLKYNVTGSGTFDSTRIKVGDSGGSGSPGGNVMSLLVIVNMGITGASQALYGADINGVEYRIGSGNKQEFLKSGVILIGSSTTSITGGVWQQYGVTYDGTTARFYLNGQPDGSGASAQTFTHTQQYELTGRNNTLSDNFGGTTDSFIALTAVFDSVLTPRAMLSLSKNPWQIFPKKVRRSVNTTAGGGLTLALSGVSETSSAGSLTPASSVSITGVSETSAVGTLVPSASLSVSGVSETSSVGALTPGSSVSISGVSETSAVGTVTYSASANLTLSMTGVQSTASVGTLISAGGQTSSVPFYIGGGYATLAEQKRRRKQKEEERRESREGRREKKVIVIPHAEPGDARVDRILADLAPELTNIRIMMVNHAELLKKASEVREMKSVPSGKSTNNDELVILLSI